MKLTQLLLLVGVVYLFQQNLVYSQDQDSQTVDTTHSIMESAPKIFIDYDKLDLDHTP